VSTTAAKPIAEADLRLVLEQTRALWEPLRGQNLFITGGTGFFGCWLLETFAFINDRLALNAKAFVLTRNAGKFAAKCPHLATKTCFQFVEGDVRNFAFPAGKFTAVIHAATEVNSTLNVEAPLTMFDSIVAGTRRVLDAERAGRQG
jgi:dTDP-glucose 4,6-dehydratase